MTKKTYADECIERAEKATRGPWEFFGGGKESVRFQTPEGPMRVQVTGVDSSINNAEFIANARTDVPELARRLKKACEYLRKSSYTNLWNIADELEKPLNEDK